MSRTSGADGPEDVDATFERIVADLRAEGVGAGERRTELDRDDTDEPGALRDVDVIDPGDTTDPADLAGAADTDGDDAAGSGRTKPPPEREGPGARGRGEADRADRGETARTGGTGWRESETGWDETMFGPDPSNDEHYVPPEPPPLPKPRKGAFLVLLFFVVGLLLLISPGLIGLNSTIGTPLGMLALAIGIALGLLRVKQGPPDGADPSNGAQL